MSRRTPVTGPALVRVLARLADIDSSSESRQSFPDRLSQWLRWNDAISLAGALNAAPAAVRAVRAVDADADYRQVRAALEAAIAADGQAGRAGPGSLPPVPGAEPEADFPAFRHRYQTRQQAMEAGIGPLRARLRARLAARSAEHARLAAVDAVMEQVMGARERSLLLHVPALLERRFRRLQADAAAMPPAEDGTAPAVATNLWLQQFRREMHELLLAELDLRLQPVEGLLAALAGPAAAVPPATATS